MTKKSSKNVSENISQKSKMDDSNLSNKREDHDSAYDDDDGGDETEDKCEYSEEDGGSLTDDSAKVKNYLKRKSDDRHNNFSIPFKRKKEGASKCVSADELNKWREIQFLHHSNLFRLQMNEMLSTIEIKQKTKVRINSWLGNFTKFIKDMPKSKLFQLNNLKWLKEHEICLPFKTFSELPELNGIFMFCPPQEVLMIGSFPLGLATTHSSTVDVALVLPKEFMQTNDLHNGKWLFRRALYLSWLGKILQMNTDLATNVSWTQHCGSHLRPTLQVTPAGKLEKSWKINLYPLPPEDYFKITLISPTRNNVFTSWYFRKDKKEVNSQPPTPHYNWLCGVDMVMLTHHQFIKTRLKHLNWIQGVKLLKIWMAQRNLNQGEGGISSHLMTLFVIHLSTIHKISSQMSPYQVFRTALLHLSQTDWCTEGPSLFEEKMVSDRNQIILTPENFHSSYPVVFVDSTGYLNLAGNILRQGYLELKHEAKTGLEVLELSTTNSFDALFIQKVEFHMTFDQTIQVRFDNDTVSRIFKDKETDTEACIVDGLGDARVHVFTRVVSTLSLGLGDRVELIGVFRGKNETWSYGCDSPDLNCTLTLGLLVNPRTSTGLLTKGPSADTSEASEFREFWGELSCLRRFKDSTFHEAVLWMENGEPLSDRRLITGKIVACIMKKHFKVSGNKICYVARQLEDILQMPYKYDDDDTFKYGTGEEANSLVVLAFDTLSKKLRSLDLPLKISSIQSASDVLKHSAVYPPMALPVPRPYYISKETITLYKTLPGPYTQCPFYRALIDIQVFFEISGKWPDDLLAIKAIKVEFMCKMAHLLKQEGITAVVFPSNLQLIWEGYVFNVKVCYRREIYLLRLPPDEGVSGFSEQDTDDSIKLEKEIEICPRMTSSLNSLQSEFPSFSGAVRLIRRWVSSQLLIPHFPRTVIDLLVAHIYLAPYPYTPPNTPHVALLRFMNFMTKSDWKTLPIFVNLRNQFGANDESELMKRFTDNRASLPHLFVCTPCELRPLVGTAEPTAQDLNRRYKLASCWSKSNPTLPILNRMKVVANAALETFTRNMWKKNFDFMVLFRPPLNDYDVLIFLNENELARRLERIGTKSAMSLKRYKHLKGENLPPVDFDPVQSYLKELRAAFDSHALFFHDEHGGSIIGVVWKPHVFEEKDAKMGSLEGHKLVGINEVKQIVNVDAIVEEFKILGEGLIKEVKLKS